VASVVFVASLALAAAGCPRPLGQFVWVDEYSAPGQTEYQILPGDGLQVRVYKEDALSARVRVRSDGMVTLPLINDVPAAGHTAAAADAAAADVFRRRRFAAGLG